LQYASDRPTQVSGTDIDRFYARIFIEQIKKDPVRVAALYLPGFDILNYEFFESKKMNPFVYTDLYRMHVAWLDETLQQIHRSNGDSHLLLILHQGRSLRNDRSGVWIRWSDAARQEPAQTEIAQTAIVPLLIHSCGLPVAKNMDPGLISLALPTSKLAAAPPRFIPAYPKKVTTFESEHVGEFNDLLIEQMKSLGYLQ
jgi:hypothetical protein